MDETIWFKYRVTLDVCAQFNANEVPTADSGEALVRASLEAVLADTDSNGEYLADGEVLAIAPLNEKGEVG